MKEIHYFFDNLKQEAFKCLCHQAVLALGCYHQISFASNINNYSLGEAQFMIRNPRSADKLGYS